MIEINWLVVFATALVPSLVGMVWYGPLFSKLWMQEAGMTQEKIDGGNMALTYGLALFFSVFLVMGVVPAVIHQWHVYSALQNVGVDTVGSEAHTIVSQYIAAYGREFRTFGHGAMHGFITALCIVFPVVATNALFERKSWKYIFITFGYWAVSMTIMGGIISQFA